MASSRKPGRDKDKTPDNPARTRDEESLGTGNDTEEVSLGAGGDNTASTVEADTVAADATGDDTTGDDTPGAEDRTEGPDTPVVGDAPEEVTATEGAGSDSGFADTEDGPAIAGEPDDTLAGAETVPGADPWGASAGAASSRTDETARESTSAERPDATTSTTSTTPATPTPPARTGGGLAGAILGGIIAAAIGFLAAQYANGGWPFTAGDDPFRSDTEQALSEQGDRLAALESSVEGAARGEDLAALQSAVEDSQGASREVAERLEQMQTTLDGFAARLDEVEKRPIDEGVSEAAIQAYERELARLQDAVAAQRKEIETIASDAAQMEENAQTTARQTMARSAVTRILTALDAGDPFAPALADLQQAGTDAPEVLRQVADEGVATRTQLEDAFPDVARDALSAAREQGSGGDTGSRLGNFLRDQLGARSVTPRSGDDPDAVLSRAEAAVKEGRINDALAEIGTLPEPAQAELSDWAARATARRDALDAAESLAQSLNQ